MDNFKFKRTGIFSKVLLGHAAEMGKFKEVVSRGQRKCFLCKNIISRGEKLQEGYILDLCHHFAKGRKYFMHCKIQFCLECLKRDEVKEIFPRRNFNRYTALLEA